MKIIALSLPVMAAALLAGCASDRDAPAAPSTTTTTVTATATTSVAAPPQATVTVTAPPSPSSVTPAPPVTNAAPVRCTDADLKVSNKPLESQGSEYRLVLNFENVSSKPCTLQGYAGADLVNETGPVAHAERRPQNAAPLLTLQPGDVAVADLQSSDTHPSGQGPCPRWGEVIVIAPNTFQEHHLGVGMPFCKALISTVT